MKSPYIFWSAICLFLISGCGSTHQISSQQSDVEDRYLLTVSQDGAIHNRDNKNLTLKEKIDLLIQGVEVFLEKKQEALEHSTEQKNKRIVLYIHGGLNDDDDSVKRAEESIEKMKDSNTHPIFITWRSGYLTTLGDHYFRIRHGETSELAPFTAPVYIASDFFKTIGNIPMSWYREGYQIVTTNWLNNDQEDIDQDVVNGIVDLTHDQRNRWNIFRRSVWLLTAPVKLLTTPAVFTLGGPAWNNMSRRTLTMFVSEDDLQPEASRYSEGGETEYNVSPSGAAHLFLKELNEFFKKARKKYPEFEVTIIGHSMGCMVANQALLALPEFDVDNIVYMGSADRLQNYLNVTNIISHYRQKESPNIYNLHLHPENENREINVYGAAPSGSLLAWIDHSYGAPEYILQRTSGRWSNMRKIVNLIPSEQRAKHHFKVFGRGSEGASPQKHGDFDKPEFEFWEKTFWTGDQVTR
ncbi:MAG: hypothetical protein D3925_13290 [Candidatus Electrothrix sp. AR5]|nr:hypothetical protein [Candidatus Electrothrix sp. AR5]